MIRKLEKPFGFGGRHSIAGGFSGRLIRGVFVLAILSASSMKAERSVAVSIDTNRSYFPGELVEVDVTLQLDRYESATFEAPRHPWMRLVEIQASPIKLDSDGQYKQGWLALYQVARSGTIELPEGRVVVGLSNESKSLSVRLGVLTARTFDEVEDHDDPEPLPEPRAETASGVWVAVLIALALAFVLVWGWRVRLKFGGQHFGKEEDSVALEAGRLRSLIEEGKPYGQELESFFFAHREQCSSQLAALMERALYAREGRFPELSGLIGKEFGV